MFRNIFDLHNVDIFNNGFSVEHIAGLSLLRLWY